MFLLFVVALSFYFPSIAKYVGDIPDQAYGYIDIRPGTHMFYWFYGSNNTQLPRNDLPIVLWLQGGPGGGGSGYGNYGEMGPFDSNFQPRQYAWSNKVNLLFLDNPVGAGYSYVDNISLIPTNVSQISNDLLTCHKQLTAKYPFMKQLPYWIFSESYGGKMTSNFGVLLYNSISNGDIAMNFQGVVLGDSWISGISYINTYAKYLYALTLIDNNQYNELMNTANQCQQAINNGNWTEATYINFQMQDQVSNYTNNVDWYYITQFDLDQTYRNNNSMASSSYYHLDHMETYLSVQGGMNMTKIYEIMNNQVKQQLGIIPNNVTWGGQSNDVFKAQTEDLMKPVVNDVDTLLANGISVNIENGQLDLMCSTLGTLEWLQTINWKYKQQYHNCAKVAVKNPDKTDVAYFKKSYFNFAMYYMMKAGHMVPADNPIAAQMMLCDITGVPF